MQHSTHTVKLAVPHEHGAGLVARAAAANPNVKIVVLFDHWKRSLLCGHYVSSYSIEDVGCRIAISQPKIKANGASPRAFPTARGGRGSPV
jgi:hypothetical protein